MRKNYFLTLFYKIKKLKKMDNNNDYTVDKLNHLIAIAEDGKEGYENAAKNIDSEVLKHSFALLSQDRAQYATQLRRQVYQLTGEAETKGGGPAGALHRVWMDLKSIFTGGGSDAIVNACITGEETAVKEYAEVLNDSKVFENNKQIIAEQLHSIQQALLNLKSYVNA